MFCEVLFYSFKLLLNTSRIVVIEQLIDHTNHVLALTDETSQQLVSYITSEMCERRLDELNEEKLMLKSKVVQRLTDTIMSSGSFLYEEN